jgi:hypothetical protein
LTVQYSKLIEPQWLLVDSKTYPFLRGKIAYFLPPPSRGCCIFLCRGDYIFTDLCRAGRFGPLGPTLLRDSR